jgi:hypothetical protein
MSRMLLFLATLFALSTAAQAQGAFPLRSLQYATQWDADGRQISHHYQWD